MRVCHCTLAGTRACATCPNGISAGMDDPASEIAALRAENAKLREWYTAKHQAFCEMERSYADRTSEAGRMREALEKIANPPFSSLRLARIARAALASAATPKEAD